MQFQYRPLPAPSYRLTGGLALLLSVGLRLTLMTLLIFTVSVPQVWALATGNQGVGRLSQLHRMTQRPVVCQVNFRWTPWTTACLTVLKSRQDDLVSK
jgi:hypothetical protein